MENWRDILQLKDGEHLNFNVTLYKCVDDYLNDTEPDITDHVQHQYPTSTAKPPLLKNLLGESMFESLQGWFVDPERDQIDEVKETVIHVDPCQMIYNGEFKVYPTVLFFRLWVLLFTLFAVLVTVYYIRKRLSVLQDLHKQVNVPKSTECISYDQTVESKELAEKSNVESLTEVTSCDQLSIIPEASLNNKPDKCQNGTSLVYYGQIRTNLVSEKSDKAFTFLEKTSDKLFKKLDKLLLKGMAEGQGATQTPQSTPRLARRGLHRRQRTGSSPMLASMVDSVENSQDDMENEEQETAWTDFKHFSNHFSWKYPPVYHLNSSNFSPNVQKLLHYYKRVCPIPQNTWKTSTLIANYVLYLMSMELENLKSKSGYRFIEFLGAGSVRNGTKVSKCNQFDVLMLLQPPVIPDTVIGNSVDVPPGMVAIGSQANKNVTGKNILGKFDVNGVRFPCLSAKYCLLAAEDLIEESLHLLYTNTRSALDRLPFQVKGAPTGTSIVNINTRALVGFGESEIKIRLQPVLRLPIKGWYQKPVLYASPPMMETDYKPREQTNHVSNSIHHDFYWSLETYDFEKVFYNEVSSFMQHACIDSCHLVCFMIVKCLLTGCKKSSLVDRGTYPASHISTVMKYLLLESSPDQWTFDRLADRFSDVIHFLQAAYESCRLPEFFISNPHLISKMPSVANNEVLVQKRQKNMLIDTPRETLDKRLDYLKSCLRESGLKDCIKEEFSPDMWEFEFFLFS